MSGDNAAGDAAENPAPEKKHDDHLRTRLVVFVFCLVLLLIGFGVVSTVVPREWAQWAGNRIDGHLFRGIGLGLVLGFVFTWLPLLALRQTVRPLSWTMRWTLVVIAGIAAIPNLMTLGIVVGTGHAAHAGERILDVDGPGFRFGSLLGALVAAAGLVAFWVWRGVASRRTPTPRSAS